MKVAFSSEAKRDLLDIGGWIAQENPERAMSFVDELLTACETLADMPRAFPLLPHRPKSRLRRRPYANYLIFYTVTSDQVDIARVIHGARDYETILFPKK